MPTCRKTAVISLVRIGLFISRTMVGLKNLSVVHILLIVVINKLTLISFDRNI